MNSSPFSTPSPAPASVFWGQRVVHVAFFLGVLLLGISGFLGFVRPGRISGWIFFIHVVTAPVFCLGLAALAVCGAEWHRFDPGAPLAVTSSRRVAYWATLITGSVTLGSILLAMLPLMGSEGQRELYGIHFWSALALFGCAGFYGMTVLRSPKRGSVGGDSGVTIATSEPERKK